MGTRSTIARVDGDKIKAIYCHWDGYPSNNGCLLVGNYTSDKLVDALLDLGDLSKLGKVIGEKHDFDEATKIYGKKGTVFAERLIQNRENWCVSYGRDRGEDETQAREFNSLKELSKWAKDNGTEWLYVWENGVWMFCDTEDSIDALKELNKDSFCKIAKKIVSKGYIDKEIESGCKIAGW